MGSSGTSVLSATGVFKNVSYFSKTLVFSSWEMVPRMIAGLLSYEAERKTVGKLAKANEDKEAHYFYTGEKRYPSARLNFSVSNGTPNAMTLFCLMYPSQFLSRCYDPIDCINRGLTLREIEKEIKGKIADKLVKYETTTSVCRINDGIISLHYYLTEQDMLPLG